MLPAIPPIIGMTNGLIALPSISVPVLSIAPPSPPTAFKTLLPAYLNQSKKSSPNIYYNALYYSLDDLVSKPSILPETNLRPTSASSSCTF